MSMNRRLTVPPLVSELKISGERKLGNKSAEEPERNSADRDGVCASPLSVTNR